MAVRERHETRGDAAMKKIVIDVGHVEEARVWIIIEMVQKFLAWFFPECKCIYVTNVKTEMDHD